VAYCLEELAEMLRLQGKRVEMEAPLRESLAIYETRLPDSWWGFSIRSELGGVLFEQEKYTEAEPLLLSGYEGMIQREDKIPDRYKGHVRRALQRLVKLYEATNRPNQSAEWKQKLEEFEHAEARKRAPAAIQTPVTKPLPGPPVPATTALLDARDGQDLLQKIGQTVTVKGEIVAFGTSTSRTFHYLNFLDQNYSGALTLAFRIADNPVEFREELLRGYLNKTVVVQGMISEHRGGPQFLMKSLAQIQIWDEGRQPKGTNEAPK
jgi:hypothetical protein